MEHNYRPPFVITNSMISDISEISELIGRISATRSASPSTIQKNRFRAISSTLSISMEALDETQVAAIIKGQETSSSQETIQAVQNMSRLYKQLGRLDPYSVSNLLTAHSIMMDKLLPDAGSFSPKHARMEINGIFQEIGPFPEYITQIISNLLHWVETDETHPLIKSCIFHYMLELHHPFSDGNGRMARLWHTLLLSKWKPLFSWIPIDPRLYTGQKLYRELLPESKQPADGTALASFLLQTIRETLEDTDNSAAPKTGSKIVSRQGSKTGSKDEERWANILDFLEKNDSIKNRDIQNLFGVTSSTATRILKKFEQMNLLERMGSSFHEYYILKDSYLI